MKKPAVKEMPDVDLKTTHPASDKEHHERVLAKARQAAHISAAVGYKKSGEVVKAMLELSKALEDNSICRTPAVVAHTKDELQDLYRLHLANTEQPPNFATLLQLQEMLAISISEAELIEKEFLHSPGAFAI